MRAPDNAVSSLRVPTKTLTALHTSLMPFNTATSIPCSSKKRTHISDKKDDDKSCPEDDGDEEQEEEERVLLAGVAVLLVERV